MTYSVLLHSPSTPVPRDLLREMFRLRREVFADRHGWSVNVRAGLERDPYDLMAPVYGLCVGPEGRVDGCWRLLPSSGPTLFKDVPMFRPLVDGAVPDTTLVWEATRFAIRMPDPGDRGDGLGRVHAVTGLLLEAMLELGLDHGIRQMVAICELPFERLLRRCGLETHRLGQPLAIGNAPAVAGYFEASDENLARVRQRCLTHLRPDPVTVAA